MSCDGSPEEWLDASLLMLSERGSRSKIVVNVTLEVNSGIVM